MCCNRTTLLTRNTSAQLLAIGDNINLGMTAQKTGNGLHLCNNAIVISGTGDYDAIASITAAPTAAGTITVTAYRDGVAIPGATASATSGAGEPVTLSVLVPISVICPKNSRSAVTFVISGAAGTVSNIAVFTAKT